MAIGFIFRCQFCDAQPDPLTQISLEKAMRENTWGAYQDALPGRWLVFHARGLYGAPRYACEEHRGDLVAYLREHYGTVGFHATEAPRPIGAIPYRAQGHPLWKLELPVARLRDVRRTLPKEPPRARLPPCPSRSLVLPPPPPRARELDRRPRRDVRRHRTAGR